MAVRPSEIGRCGPVVFAAALGLFSNACVSKVRYDACVADGARARTDAAAVQQQLAAQLGGAQQQLAATEAAVQDRDAKLSELGTAQHNTQAQLDQATAIHQQLRGELQRLGTDVDKMLADRGTLAKALDDARVRLEELRKAQAQAEARAALFRELQQRFKPLIDAGQVSIETRRGAPVIEVPSDLLFDEATNDVREAGKGALMEIARAIQITSPPSTGRRFLVIASTDANVDADARDGKADRTKADRTKPARKPRPSDWAVAAARAVAVVEFLVRVGVAPASLTAASAGSADPLAPTTPENRPKNRRIEIALLPSG